ncbi:hypothetical protein BUALT_Bualt08G0130700 [Buddleja alternifolia]|uniref:F-box domain-containing protein n=1 Tax=Buddleja alternifolia TaxID=168488 RepID=A0AAV6XCL9_9LAMI|nr:hypothetical protein BUALT_Bualt08G0130700 [Buddleja alternifolia]
MPSEITTNILSRLPFRNIIISKCVCKPWLDLIETHLSKSVPGLILHHCEDQRNVFTILDFEEAVEELQQEELRYNRITELDVTAFISLPDQFGIRIEGSANGLLFLRNLPNALYICNPITREYMELPNPKEMGCYIYPTIVSYGFGVTKMSGEYKVVRIYSECVRYPRCPSFLSISKPKSECQVYTLGTGSWRSVPPGDDTLEYDSRSVGMFLSGNFHWLVADLKGSCLISCLNLETEVFRRLSTSTTIPESGRFLWRLVVLGDCLCLCDNTSDDEIVIWVMKEYGVDKSWKKEFVISKISIFAGESSKVVYPLKVFRDGDILMSGEWEDDRLFYYSNKTKTTKKIDMLKLRYRGCIDAMLHTSSFVLLKSFVNENVTFF